MASDANQPRPTLALVDDSDEVRTMVRTRLELSGLFDIVGEGRDGTEAIGLAYRHEPNLLLLDTSMPTMDGIEALPAVLTLSPETRVVIFTGFEERGLADLAREMGAADFIEKSLPIEQLPERLVRVLGGDDAAPAPHRRGLRVASGAHRPDTDLRRDQAALDEHIERFREVFERAAIGMATLTLNGSIVRANTALADMMGATPEDLVGVDYGRLTAGQGEDLDRGLQAITDLGDDLVSLEHPLPGGEWRTVRVTLAPIRDSKNQPLYVFAQVQDISAQRFAEDELRRSEERFRLLVTAVGEYAIYMLDPEGRVISWNAGAQRIKGYAADDIIGQHFRIFYPEEEQHTGHPETNLSLALRDGAYAEEGWRVRRDGSRFWASVVITAVYDETGRHIGFAKVTHDQTDQRLYEEQHQRAVEQQTHLLAVTAHELRNPTAVIDGSAALLLESWHDLAEDDRARLLAAIGSSAHRLQRLVSDLATASRVQSDTLRLDPQPVPLQPILRGCWERARAAHPEASIELVGDEDATVAVDAGRLGQAVDNLIDNALRHGGAPVTITTEVLAEEVRVTVSDAGPGVAAELTPRLFDRFAIGGPTGGTGLGLYLVREIARGHGGEVVHHPRTADRRAGFTLTLPLASDD